MQRIVEDFLLCVLVAIILTVEFCVGEFLVEVVGANWNDGGGVLENCCCGRVSSVVEL